MYTDNNIFDNEEYWAHIDIFEGEFYVSNKGRVLNNRTGNFLKGDTNENGYHRVQLYYKGNTRKLFRHRLVAMYFIPNDDPENKIFVNHKNGDINQNDYTNLEWVTPSENAKHAFRLGLSKPNNKPFIVEMRDGRKLYKNQYQLSEELNISQSCVSNWLKNGSDNYKKYGITNIYYL